MTSIFFGSIIVTGENDFQFPGFWLPFKLRGADPIANLHRVSFFFSPKAISSEVLLSSLNFCYLTLPERFYFQINYLAFGREARFCFIEFDRQNKIK